MGVNEIFCRVARCVAMVRKIGGYKLISRLGTGAAGTIYQVIKDDKLFAMKVYKEDIGIPLVAIREINILTRIDHPNVVKMDKVVGKSNQICLLMELADMDLYEYINNEKYDPLQIFSDIVCGLAELHANKIIHGDLKPQNCLVKDGVVKITDLNSFISPKNSVDGEDVSTLWWRAPEIIEEHKFSDKVDIWALGCILYQLYAKRELIRGRDIKEIMDDIDLKITRYRAGTLDSDELKYLVEPLYSGIPRDILKLLFSMLQVDPKKRPNIKRILNHPLVRKRAIPTRHIFSDIDGVNETYLRKHAEKRKEMILLMRQMCQELGIQLHIFYTAIDIFDRVYSRDNRRLYDYMICSVWIASKLFEVYGKNLYDILRWKHDDEIGLNARVEKICKYEYKIVNKLGWKIYRETMYSISPSKEARIYKYLLNNPTPRYPGRFTVISRIKNLVRKIVDKAIEG